MNIVSFGGGTNSTAMIIEMYRRGIPIDLILFADTGGERPETYEFIEIFNGWLLEHGLPEITIVEYYRKNGERMSLEDECLRSKTLPAIAYGYKKCSLKHKIGTQIKYCNNLPECRAIWKRKERVNKYIGYDAGEPQRKEHAAERDAADKKYNHIYPLIDWGINREGCKKIIQEAGLPFPGKSSCFFCPSMKKAEIQQLWTEHPDLFQRAIEIEHKAKDTLDTVKGLGRNWSWESYKYAYDINGNLFEFLDSMPNGCQCGLPCGCYEGQGGINVVETHFICGSNPLFVGTMDCL